MCFQNDTIDRLFPWKWFILSGGKGHVTEKTTALSEDEEQKGEGSVEVLVFVCRDPRRFPSRLDEILGTQGQVAIEHYLLGPSVLSVTAPRVYDATPEPRMFDAISPRILLSPHLAILDAVL